MIFYLAKVFQEREHAKDFVSGRMYANRLSYFKKIEDHDGRGDEDEGAIMFQLDGLTATLEFTNMDTGEVERTTMTELDFAAPPILRPEWFDDINVFCMYAGHSGEFQHVSPDNLQEFRRQLEIPEEYTRLGRHAVFITNTTEFLKRVEIAANRAGYGLRRGLVRYYDAEVGTPPIRSDIETIFTKRKEYEHQREFRFAIDTGTTGCCPIILDVGEINDISMCTDTCNINQTISYRD
jgi:hypothetical protein